MVSLDTTFVIKLCGLWPYVIYSICVCVPGVPYCVKPCPWQVSCTVNWACYCSVKGLVLHGEKCAATFTHSRQNDVMYSVIMHPEFRSQKWWTKCNWLVPCYIHSCWKALSVNIWWFCITMKLQPKISNSRTVQCTVFGNSIIFIYLNFVTEMQICRSGGFHLRRPTCAGEQACNVIQGSFSSLQMILIALLSLVPLQYKCVWCLCVFLVLWEVTSN
jgi:hypothetical protein